MDRSGDNENSRSNKRKDDDSNSRLVEDNVGRKRKRDNSSASSYPQHGGEATTQTTALHQADRDEGREQQTTSQKRVMEPSKQQLLVEIRELRKELRDREREIEALRGELEREKQRWLKRDNESQSNEDTTIANDGIITSAAAPGSSVKERESNEFDASTDEDMIQLSSTSSMDRHHHRHLNGADNADADEGSEGHISSVESRMNGNDYNDKEIKAVGGENEKENKVADSCNTTTSRSGETNRGQQLRANDNAGDDEEEQNKVVQIPQTERQKEESDDEVVGDDGTLAFCCQSCTCNNSTTTVKLYSCVHSCDGTSSSMVGNMNLYHKGCCHNEKGDENLFKSPMQISREKGFAMEQKEKRGQEISLQQMKQKYEHAKKEAAQVANEEYLAAEDSKIYSCPVYETYVEKFQQRKGTHESPLRVLELFSGIGSGTLALKRLRIPLRTIVHCEHDPLANEVCKFNHQRDGIRHVYIDTFEEIYGERNEANHDKVAKLVADHGPFDLVLAGAPCSSYSGLNANRNASCANAQYLPNVGKLITKLNNIQTNNHGVKYEVLFISENVVFKDYDKIAACYGGLEPIRLDAKDFSPCKRDRFYWCNVSCDSFLSHRTCVNTIAHSLFRYLNTMMKSIPGSHRKYQWITMAYWIQDTE
jgi:hypothetical protein